MRNVFSDEGGVFGLREESKKQQFGDDVVSMSFFVVLILVGIVVRLARSKTQSQHRCYCYYRCMLRLGVIVSKGRSPSHSLAKIAPIRNVLHRNIQNDHMSVR